MNDPDLAELVTRIRDTGTIRGYRLGSPSLQPIITGPHYPERPTLSLEGHPVVPDPEEERPMQQIDAATGRRALNPPPDVTMMVLRHEPGRATVVHRQAFLEVHRAKGWVEVEWNPSRLSEHEYRIRAAGEWPEPPAPPTHRDALRSILAMHQPGPCAECGQPYPCATAQALQEALRDRSS